MNPSKRAPVFYLLLDLYWPNRSRWDRWSGPGQTAVNVARDTQAPRIETEW